MTEYSIVIPVYNESDKITASLTQVLTFMRNFTPSFEVIVVDDGSKDNTAIIVEEYARINPEIRVIKNPHKGKGPSVWTGVTSSVGKYVYMADADFSAPIQELKKLSVWIIDQDYDIVIASREGYGAVRVKEPFYRHLMGRVFNFFVQLFLLPGIRDSQCGFKLFKGDVAREIFARLKLYGAEAKETKKAYFGAFDVEVLFLATKMGYKIKEVPVIWTYVKTTRLSPVTDSIKMLKDIILVRINFMKGKYNL
jgi:dolichyl-phosphate beta-glucosyltransferase